MIRITRLTKTFGRATALSDINLDIARGECLGLVGSNGAGRTTLLRIVATLLAPTLGTVEIDGLEVVANVFRLRRRIAYVGDDLAAADGLRTGEYLRLIESTRRPSAPGSLTAADAADRARLEVNAAVATLSAGMRQRLSLAAALMTAPDVILLDDPFRALDSESRVCFMQWLTEAREAGGALIMATNDEDDWHALCQRVARLEAGRLVNTSRLASGPISAPRVNRLAVTKA